MLQEVYELITGSFLGSWLIGSAIGASIAGKSELNDIKKLICIFYRPCNFPGLNALSVTPIPKSG